MTEPQRATTLGFMPFPPTLTLVTVTGAFDVPPSGGATGTVQFIADRPLQGSTIVPPFERTAALAADGTFTIQLPATNDPQWAPSGWAYRVVATVAGAVFSGTLQLDHQATSVTLAALLQPNGAAVTGATYLLLSQRGVAGGVAGLDADGDVIDADGDKVGGGGGTPSATVVSETAYGQSATAGAATTFARGDHTHGTPAAPVAATITDSTTTGRAVLTAASQAAARTAIGAGTSDLALGSTGTTAAAGNHAHTATAITDSTTVGRSVLTAIDAAAARTAIGAEASGVAAALVDDLSGVTNATTARTNLGLGGAAILNVGTTAGTVAAGNTPAAAQAAAEATAAATYLPKLGAEITDSTFTVRKSDGSSQLRFRSSGGAVDIDKTNGDVAVSSFSGPGFAGTQTGLQRWRADGTTLSGLVEFGSSIYAGEQSISTVTGVAALGAKNSLANVRLCGFRASTGAPAAGAWATGDVVLDSAGRWYLCTAGGTPGTWTTPARSGAVVKGYVTSGNITPQNTAGAWAALTGGPTVTIAAAIGDEILFDWAALQQRNLTTFYDACVLVGGSPVRFASSGGATAAVEGDPGWYPDAPSFLGHASPFAFTAASGDISGGNVTIGFAVKSAGSGLLYASTSFPLRYRLVNSGPSA